MQFTEKRIIEEQIKQFVTSDERLTKKQTEVDEAEKDYEYLIKQYDGVPNLNLNDFEELHNAATKLHEKKEAFQRERIEGEKVAERVKEYMRIVPGITLRYVLERQFGVERRSVRQVFDIMYDAKGEELKCKEVS